MRVLLAAVMAVTLAAATIVDRVACPDGCTDEAQHETTSTTTTSTCGFCQGWSASGIAILRAPLSSPVQGLATIESFEQSPHLAPIDHPPRIV